MKVRHCLYPKYVFGRWLNVNQPLQFSLSTAVIIDITHQVWHASVLNDFSFIPTRVHIDHC